MTLAQWSTHWPYRVTVGQSALEAAACGRTIDDLPNATMAVTPDSIDAVRSGAWSLEDYRVSSVRGGSIWFMRRETH